MRKTFLQYAIASVCCLSVTIAGGDDSSDDLSVTFWGGIDHRDFGETSDPLIETWDHKLTSAQLGVDAHVADNLLAGAAVSWSQNDHDILLLNFRTPDSVDSGVSLTGVHPYIKWSAPDKQQDWWAAFDYGKGDVDISLEFSPTCRTDIYMKTTKIGTSRLFLQRSETEWRLKGEIQHARGEVAGDRSDASCIPQIKYDSNRLRVALEAKQPSLSIGGTRLQPSVQAGVRYYGGNLGDGATVEIDGLLRYRSTVHGLTWEGRAWALDGISGDEENDKEWSISATLRLARANWRGLSFSLTSGYGSHTSDIHEIWRKGWWTRPLDRNPQAWFYARITYGLTPHPVWTTCPRLRAGC